MISMKKSFKLFLSVLFIILAVICFALICKTLDKNIDILSWCGGCAFYMLGQILAKWIYE